MFIEDQGCLEDFHNTASFSRSYQASQDCMCDTEHMFDCPSVNNQLVEDPMDVARVDFSRLLQQSLKVRIFSSSFRQLYYHEIRGVIYRWSLKVSIH